jgi:DNA modification methylase
MKSKKNVANEDKPVETVNHLKHLKADPQNARLHNPRNIGTIVDSLHEVGAARSIVIDENNVVLAGNGVVEAAGEAGIEKVRVVEADGNEVIAVRRRGLTPQQKTRLALFDNRAAELAEWNPEELVRLDKECPQMLEGMFYDGELETILEDAGISDVNEVDAEPQVDKAAELQKKWGVKSGDLWQLGSHKLICGDCTDAKTVARVMGGEKAQLVATDPPYGVKYGDKLDAANPVMHGVRSIQNDNLDADQLQDLWRRAFKLAADSSVPGGAIYAAAAAGDMLLASMQAFDGSGYTFKWQLVWLKDRPVLSRGDYHFKHENILYGWKEDAAHFFTEDRTQNSVFEYPRPSSSDEHPTMKPVELYEHLLRNSSKHGDIIYEPFSGSGTTLLACERLGRKARACEISPAYVAVALQRWADATGKTPVLIP